jgi:hypothetical protein
VAAIPDQDRRVAAGPPVQHNFGMLLLQWGQTIDSGLPSRTNVGSDWRIQGDKHG